MEGHVILFPGQGAQYIGMAGELCKRNPASAAVFEQAASLVTIYLKFALKALWNG